MTELNGKNFEVLFTKEQIAKRVEELGAQLTKDYAGKDLIVVGILTGSLPFMADLVRCIDLDIRMDFMKVSSYGAGKTTTGSITIKKDLELDIAGKDVLIVEDIIDSGVTYKNLREELLKRNPASLKIVTILDKPSRRQVEIAADYTGFTVDDLFIVGYGLDADQHYRNLPYISWVK